MDGQSSFGRGKLNSRLDVNQLIDRIGLTEDEIAWRKDFINFDAEDEQRLAALEPMLVANQDAIADDFYENLVPYEQTRAVVGRSPKGLEALKQTQRASLTSLAAGSYDQSYFKNRARIGKLHDMLDMPLKHYIGQYGVYYELIMSRLNERIQNQVVEAIESWAEEQEADESGGFGRLAGALGFGRSETDEDESDGLEESFEATVRESIDDGMMDILSLLRIINLDLQVATDTYVDSYTKRLDDSIERHEQLARDVEDDVQAPIEELQESSGIIAERAEAISTHAERQSTGVDNVSGELTDISAAVEEVANVSSAAHEQSERTEFLTRKGAYTADVALEELEAIETAVDDVAAATASLESRAAEIDGILERLDELTRRTNVLAKNAKIESSRRGQEGQSSTTLGVIATEVKTFAEQTKSDLQAIEAVVDGITDDTEETVAAANEAVKRVNTGGDSIRETIDSLEEIHTSARLTATGMEEVTAATEQQAASIESVANSLDSIAATANAVADDASSVAAASQQQTASLTAVSETVSMLTDEAQIPALPASRE